ncbi:MAG: flavodoxin-dependent (E)-4-hydroxy-3-methylbut-2-enyl-diphosphate synthase [candidate division WOR-3 bacterium]
MIKRKKTREVKIGSVKIGNLHPIAVQSMTKTKTSNWQKVLKEIRRLEIAGCEIIRLAFKDFEDIEVIPKLKERSKVPLVGDFHFDYRLAIEGIKRGLDKIRINPANIKEKWQLREICLWARDKGIPIRIGLNTGSFRSYRRERLFSLLEKTVSLLERNHFSSIVISAKTPSPMATIAIYEKISKDYPYPLHLGLTEAGLPFEGGIRTALSFAPLLLKGIGDTLRVSLTGDAVWEVEAAYEILQGLGLRKKKPIFITCPTCGRCQVNLIKIAQAVKRELKRTKPALAGLRIAVMGCEVNGPGEASQADFGIACGKDSGLIFKKGKVVRKVRAEGLVEEFVKLILEDKTSPLT